MNAPTAGWDNFFVAVAGASAALSGLLFVAMSINLPRILEIKHLPARAGESLVVLLTALEVATFGLVPGQSRLALGLEMGLSALLSWSFCVTKQVQVRADPEALRHMNLRVFFTQAATLPFVVAGVLLVAGYDRGIYAVVPGTIASFAVGVMSAWVLLVEILR